MKPQGPAANPPLLEERSTAAAQSKNSYNDARTKGHHRNKNREIASTSAHARHPVVGPTRATLPRAAARLDKTRTSNSSHQSRACAGRSASTEAYRPTPPPPAECTARQLVPSPRPLHDREHHPQPDAWTPTAAAARRRRRRRRRRINQGRHARRYDTPVSTTSRPTTCTYTQLQQCTLGTEGTTLCVWQQPACTACQGAISEYELYAVRHIIAHKEVFDEAPRAPARRLRPACRRRALFNLLGAVAHHQRRDDTAANQQRPVQVLIILRVSCKLKM